MNLDLGDIVLSLNATVKGLRPPRFRWHIGATQDTPRHARTRHRHAPDLTPRKADVSMNLHADKQVPLTVQPTDEMGNPTTFDGTITYSVDDPAVINLTDNGDGTATAAAVGGLGVAVVTVDAMRTSDGKTFQGTLALNVVAGDVEAITVSAGDESEVTPDA